MDQDERAIARRIAAYCYAVDDGDPAGLLDCFVPNGAWVTATGGERRGHAQIREFLAAIVAGGQVLQHMTSNLHVDIDGDRARAKCYLVTMRQFGAGPAPANFGRYAAELVREADGEWRFERLEVRLRSS